MQKSQQIYTIEQLRDWYEYELSERKNVPEQKHLLQRFDQIFKETIFSQKALTVHQIDAIVKDTKNKQFQYDMKDTYQILDLTLQKLHKNKKKIKKQEQQSNKQKQDDDDSFNFDSEQRQKQSSEDDVDDDYINDLRKK